MAKKPWGGRNMGLFTSYCKNCGRPVNWFILPDNQKWIDCSYCGITNTENDLFGTMMSPNNGIDFIENSVAIKRRFDDDELYQDEINDYADLPLFDHEKARNERVSKYRRVVHDQIRANLKVELKKKGQSKVTNWLVSTYNTIKQIIKSLFQ
jgi:hypothetical protein